MRTSGIVVWSITERFNDLVRGKQVDVQSKAEIVNQGDELLMAL